MPSSFDYQKPVFPTFSFVFIHYWWKEDKVLFTKFCYIIPSASEVANPCINIRPGKTNTLQLYQFAYTPVINIKHPSIPASQVFVRIQQRQKFQELKILNKIVQGTFRGTFRSGIIRPCEFSEHLKSWPLEHSAFLKAPTIVCPRMV